MINLLYRYKKFQSLLQGIAYSSIVKLEVKMNEKKKKSAAQEAIKYVKNHSIIGVGTGSTVKPFIDLLNKLVEEQHLKLSAIPTSEESKNALHKSIKIEDLSLTKQIDLTIDGADKVTKDFHLIKGGGGALLREKYVALNSKFNLTIVDDSKLVPSLSNHPLPIEIVPFGYAQTIKRLKDNGFEGNLRIKNNKTFVTDNGNYIYDIDIKTNIDDPEKMHHTLKGLSGVIETGLFLKTSDIIIIGKNDNCVDVWERGKG